MCVRPKQVIRATKRYMRNFFKSTPQVPYCDICGVDEGMACIKRVHEQKLMNCWTPEDYYKDALWVSALADSDED